MGIPKGYPVEILIEIWWNNPVVVAVHQQFANFGFPQHMLSYEKTHRQKCTKQKNSKCCKDNLPRQRAPTEVGTFLRLATITAHNVPQPSSFPHHVDVKI